MAIVIGLLCAANLASAGPAHGTDSARTIGQDDRPLIDWPSLPQIVEVATLQNYNTRLVVLSTSALGIASGLVGTLLLLRKRSLMGDALSHATLPG
ncbi:metal ABC transporter permease, partial [Thiohalocapsa sp.]|uniref:metal ABC transporter permease n=1 Tax=Thiohalocapsa sp. TaxID=2497641 RepID=UPI0025D3CB9F